MTRNFRLKALVVSLSLAAGAAANAAAPTGTPLGANGLVARATQLRAGDVVAGPLSVSQSMHIVVALKLRNRQQLDSFIAGLHAGAAKPMTPAQFAAAHSPTQAQANAVAGFMTRMGFTNVQIAPSRMLVSGDAAAAVVKNAFGTSFVSVHTHDGRQAWANTTDAHVPASLQDSVLSVIGLQNVHQPHTFAKPMQSGGANPLAVTGHNPTEFASIYGGSGVPTAAGVTIGIITEGKLTNVINDLNSFTSNNGLPTVTTQTVNTGGTSNDTSGDGEWDLDSQDIVGIGGGHVGKIIFYNEPSLSNTALTANVNAAVSRNEAKIINMSLGECETYTQQDGSAAAQDQSFQQADAQGQTFSISTGDSGADECGDGGTTPSWPAASQYVIAAAGTTLNASSTTWSSETVWSGSGGSQSTFEPKPSWQTLWSGPRRGVADIAYDANPSSGALVIVDGSTEQIGGTSLAAPLFAGAWARMIAAKGTSLGFAGPLIYQAPASAFHDITSGNNGGESAGTGYDLASGRGSVIMSQLLSSLGGGGGNQPPVANFSFTTSGLTANFTDGSSDSDGTITSHSWTFGDGGTSTATNPVHTYASGGTYSVTETVTDDDGAQGSKTQQVTVSSGGGGGSQLLGNPGWETGSASPWTMSSGTLCDSSCGESPHGGTYYAYLDGYGGSHTDNVSQTVTIPAGKTSATLTYYLHIDTSESGTHAYDHLYVRVYSTSGTLLKTLATYSNANHNSGYAQHSNSMSAYIGQTVVVKFTGTEDSSLQTSFVIDDTALNVQ